MSRLTAFTSLLQNFINELREMFPSEKELKVYQMYSSNLIKVNPRLVHKYFMTYVYPHKEQIRLKDDKFFLEKDYTEEASEFGQFDMLEAMKLKDLWKVMSPESQNQSWKYFDGLIKLAEKA